MPRRKAPKAPVPVDAPPLVPSDTPIKASDHRARQAARAANDTKENNAVSKLLTVDDILRDHKLLRGLYDTDPKFATSIDAALVHQNTAADRAAWAQQLGVDALAHPREILSALATRLGIKRAGRPPASVSAKAKPGPEAVRRAARTGGKRGRRAVDTSALQGQILGALKAGPLTSEALRKKLGAEKSDYKKAADTLLSGKKIKKSGERRNTEFRLA